MRAKQKKGKNKKMKNEIPTINLDTSNVISRSIRLLRMDDNPFEFGSLKVLDTFLSKINPLDSSVRTVRFTKREYEELLGIVKLPKKRLEQFTDQLQSMKVRLPLENGGYESIVLFSKCKVFKEKGENIVELTCSTEAKNVFFDLEGVRYIKYQLRNVINLSSIYSMFLYYYLLENEYRGIWEVSIEKLRKILRVEENKYTVLKDFMKCVVKNATEEINKHTDIRFIYNTKRKNGRNISHIEFVLLEKIDLSDFDYIYEQNLKKLNETDESIVKEALEFYKVYLEFLPTPQITEKTKEKIIELHNNNIDFSVVCCSVRMMADSAVKIAPELLEKTEKITLDWICENAKIIVSLYTKELRTKQPSKEFAKLIREL